MKTFKEPIKHSITITITVIEKTKQRPFRFVIRNQRTRIRQIQ